MGANHEALWQIDSKDFGLEKPIVVSPQMLKILLVLVNFIKTMAIGMEKKFLILVL